MTSLPFIDIDVAAAVGGRAVPPGPTLSPSAIRDVVAGLHEAASTSVAPIAEVTGLGVTGDGPMLVIDRPTWLRANAEMAATLLAEASREPWPAPERLRDKVAARANGAQLGGLLALLGTRILGQFMPFLAEPKLLLVAPNVAKVEAELGVASHDFRLWVCLHEQTHRLQFARAPWLREHLVGEVGRLLGDSEDGPEKEAAGPPARLGGLLDAMTTPTQRAVFARVGAVMSLLEGYADDMMDRVGPEVVPSVATIRSRFEKRRDRGGWTRLLNRAIGMDAKLAQYRDGARFCRAVIASVGVGGLNVVYDAPAHLPTPAEIHDPARWIARVHG